MTARPHDSAPSDAPRPGGQRPGGSGAPGYPSGSRNGDPRAELKLTVVEKSRDPMAQKTAVVVSVAVHALGMLFIGLSALLAPRRPSIVPVFEIVNLEKPKLRPIQPKAPPPPPEAPPPEPARPPDPPKLTPKPSKAVTPQKKPEPKVVKHDEDTSKPIKEAPPPQQSLAPTIVAHMPEDPRLSFWAGRVKKKAETLWNPPSGIDISGPAKAVISFKVSRDGTVSDAAVTTSAGNADLDQLALRTIQRMEHVPPIPENFPGDVIEVSYEFNYKGQ